MSGAFVTMNNTSKGTWDKLVNEILLFCLPPNVAEPRTAKFFLEDPS